MSEENKPEEEIVEEPVDEVEETTPSEELFEELGIDESPVGESEAEEAEEAEEAPDLSEFMVSEADDPWLVALTALGVPLPPEGSLSMVAKQDKAKDAKRYLRATTPAGEFHVDLLESALVWLEGSPSKPTLAGTVPAKMRKTYEAMGLDNPPGGDFSNILPYAEDSTVMLARTVQGYFHCNIEAEPLLWEAGTFDSGSGDSGHPDDQNVSVRIRRIREAARKGKPV